MKITSFLTAVAALLLPTFTEGLVGIDWSITNVPQSGLTDITFPFSIAETPHKTGYFFAQQFNFKGQSDVGYTGLQPRPNSDGKPIIHAVFSSFIKGTSTADMHCSNGADGGPGVSCSIEFSASYASLYYLEVRNIHGTTWNGTVVDGQTGRTVHIGSYTLPAGTGGIAKSQVGFIEYYPWNAGTHTCSSLPYTSVVFGVPKTSNNGAGTGSLGDAYEYGDCVGKVHFKQSRTSASGVQVEVGF